MRSPMRVASVALLVAACLQAGCVSTTVVKANSAPPMKAARDVPEQELLDVGIAIFDDGLPESGEERQKLEAEKKPAGKQQPAGAKKDAGKPA